MNIPNLDTLLIRDEISANIRSFLLDFENSRHDLTQKRGVYLCGGSGCGKTEFIKNILKSIDYDAVLFDAGDIRNKGVIESMTRPNMSNANIMSTLTKKKKPIVNFLTLEYLSCMKS